MKILKILLLTIVISMLPVWTSCGAGHNGHDHEIHEESNYDDDHDTDIVTLTPEQIKAVGISLGSFESRHLSETVSASGLLEVSSLNEGVVAPLQPGRVIKILVVEGQQVTSGQVVAWMEAPEILGLRQQIAEARQEVETTRQELSRQEALAEQGAGVRKNLDNARNAVRMAELRLEGCKGQLALYGVPADSRSGTSFPVKSGVSGIVTAIQTPVGGFADAQTPILRVTDNNGIYCMLKVPEKDINSIKPGQEVDLQLTNAPERTFLGKVVQTGPSIDMETRTVPVKVSVSQIPGLLPGMAVSARISVGASSTVSLPEGAVIGVSGQPSIFVETGAPGSGEFRCVPVATGPSALGYVGVTPLQPVPEDSRVVTAGAFYLSSMLSDHGEHNH